jgi:hypothetical protein
MIVVTAIYSAAGTPLPETSPMAIPQPPICPGAARRRRQIVVIKEIAANLAGREAGSGDIQARNARPALRQQPGLDVAGQVQLALEHGLLGILGADPIGDILQQQQPADQTIVPVGQLRDLHGVVAGRAVAVQHDLGQTLGLGLKALDQIWPGREIRQGRLAQHLVGHDSQQGLCGRIKIDKAILLVEDDKRVAHMLDDFLAGDRDGVEQAVAIQAPGQDQAGCAVGEWGQVQVVDRAEFGDVQQIGEPGHHRAGQQHRSLAPAQTRGEQDRTAKQHRAGHQ